MLKAVEIQNQNQIKVMKHSFSKLVRNVNLAIKSSI